MLIDAHHHLWKYNDHDYAWMTGDLSALRRDYMVKDLEEATRGLDVQGTIAVQARQTIAETEWLLDMANQHSSVLAVVGWVPLLAPDVSATLERFTPNPKFRGVRHVIQDEPDDRFILRDDFNRGVGRLKELGLVYDVLIYERHLPQAIEFVDRHPEQVFVVDHVAKPGINEGVLSPWREQITELARRENVYCKVSGMATEADWKHWAAEDLRPYFDVVLAAFGPRRLMFGSDWPVLTVAGTYNRWLDVFSSFIAQLSPDERERVSAGTAREAYHL